jgi:hypothetical protein
MNMTFQFSSRTVASLLFACLLCLALTLLSGCGGAKFTPAEQTEVNKYLAEHGRNALLRYLEESSKDTHSDPGEHYSRVGKYVEFFISKGADVNAKDNDGNTPLHYGIWNPRVVHLLVSKGADVNAKGNGGITPLHLAAEEGGLDTVKFLVSKGADVNAKGSNLFLSESTPLHFVLGGTRDVEIIKFLVSKGADVNAKNGYGWAPLDMARGGTLPTNYGGRQVGYPGQSTVVADYLSGVGAKEELKVGGWGPGEREPFTGEK